MMTQSAETSSPNRLLSSTKHPRISYSVSTIGAIGAKLKMYEISCACMRRERGGGG